MAFLISLWIYSPMRYRLRLFQQGQGNDDPDGGKSARDPERKEIASEEVLGRSRNQSADDRADAVGRENHTVIGGVVSPAEEDRCRRWRDCQPRPQGHPEGAEADGIKQDAPLASQ